MPSRMLTLRRWIRFIIQLSGKVFRINRKPIENNKQLWAMNPQKERILIVEDERAVARGLEYGLENEGFAVLWARTGQMALDLVYRQEPHLILRDIRLPDMSGFDVCCQRITPHPFR